jgi:multiple sugar transport system substrate-binding protein
VSILVEANGPQGPLSGPLHEVRAEFEQATGAELEIVEIAPDELFPRLVEDVATGLGRYDAAIVGAWALGELVESDYLLPLDDVRGDARLPQWDRDDVLPVPRTLLTYSDTLYMTPYDHDAQLLYYRRDLLNDPQWQQQFQSEYGYALPVPPTTYQELRDVARFFHNKPFAPAGARGSGIALHLGAGQAVWTYAAFAAASVTPALPFWFDPDDLTPSIQSPQHTQALERLVELAGYGTRGEAQASFPANGAVWDTFLQGRAALAISWGDLGALAQQEGSLVKGQVGVAPLPAFDAAGPLVGNLAGNAWGGVVSKYADAPEAAYYLLALLATRDKGLVYAARGWDGLDPGRVSQLDPNGAGYTQAGWDAADARDYTAAISATLSQAAQLPYLRLPGSYEYLAALDAELIQAALEARPPTQALANAAQAWEQLTERLGRSRQQQAYQR